MPQYYEEYINFKISADSQAVEYDQLIELSHKLIDSDFFCYFKEGTRSFGLSVNLSNTLLSIIHIQM